MTHTLPIKLSLIFGLFVLTLPDLAQSANEPPKPKYHHGYDGNEEFFDTPRAACDSWLKLAYPGATSQPPKKLPEIGDSTYGCAYKDADGNLYEDEKRVWLACPSNADMKGSNCVCNDYVWDGKRCVAAEDAPSQNTEATSTGSAGGTTTADSDETKPNQKARICEDLTKTLKATIGKETDATGKTRVKDLNNVELPPSTTKDSTIAIGLIVNPSGKEILVAGASSLRIHKPLGESIETVAKNNYARGITYKQTSNVKFPGVKGKLKNCGEKRILDYRKLPKDNAARPLEGHAESKIIEDWFKGETEYSVLYLKIGGAQTEPCSACSSVIEIVNSSSSIPGCPRIEVCPESK